MPKDFTAPSQQWNIQDQINQSKVYQQQQEQNTIKQLQQEQDFNALAEKEKPAWEKLKKYEADGYDMSMHYDKFKTIGAKDDKLDRTYKGLRKFTSEGATTLSNLFGVDDSQYRNNLNQIRMSENNWKQNQVDTNPNKYDTKDDVWNVSGGIGEALPYVAGGVAMGASKAPTLGGKLVGDIGRGAVADAYLGSLQHGYKDNFDSQLAQEVGLGVAGQTVGTGIAHLLSKVGSNVKVQPQDTAVKPQQTEVTPTQPTQPVTSQDDIAKKINDNYFGNQTVQPQATVPDTQYGNKVNDFFNPTKLPPKEDMVVAIKNAIDTDTTDDFISKLPDNVNKEKIASSINIMREAKAKQGFQPQEMVVNGETINKTDFDLIQSYQKTREWNRNNPTQKRPISARQHEAYLRNTNIADDVKDMDFNANIAEPQGRMFEPTIDDAVANKVDFETANRMGVIPFSNGSQTLGGGAAGGLESEFNQRDYNNDGVHDYKDNLVGALVGAVGIQAARKMMPKYFKDANIDKNTTGMFVGARPDERGAFSDIATKKTMREIDDRHSTLGVTKVLDEYTADTVLSKAEAMSLKKDFPNLDIYEHGLDGWKVKGNAVDGVPLQLVLDHPNLFDQYPILKTTKVIINPNKKGGASFSPDKNTIELSRQVDKSTLLHEIQHAIQSKEGWARGGNMDNMKPKDLAETLEADYGHLPSWRKIEDDFLDSKIPTEDEMYIKQINLAKDNYGGINKVKYDTYKRLHGEQQARATQARMNYTPEQRLSEDWTQTLAKTEGKYNEPIIKYDDGVANSEAKSPQENIFLAKAKARIQAKIDSGEIPERGRTVISPYDNGKQYYIGESGKVYFQTGNKKWRETPNLDTIKDVKYVAENGLTNFKKMINAEDTRFEKALKESQARELEASKTYKMAHKAPTKDSGVRSDNLVDAFSNDIYSKDAARLHGHGATAMDKESVAAIQRVRNKPDAEVTIYRAIPKDINAKINPDDWVTTSKEYAKVHGEGPLKGNYKILEMKVKAKDLYTDGNSIHEWGYSPNKSIDGMTAMSSPTLSGGMVGGIVGANNDLNGDGKTDYKDILIGIGGGAAGTKGALLIKNTQIATKAKSIIKAIGDMETVDKALGHKIYQKKDYMALREAMIKSKNADAEKFALLHEQLKLLDDTTRTKMYNYMNGDKSIQLDPNIKQLADNYTNEINKMGKELVDLGVLEQAQFDKFKDRYLHRRYEKDLSQKFNSLFTKGKTIQGVHARGNEWTGTKTEFDALTKNGEIGDFFDGKIEATKMQNGQYKFRQDWTEAQRDKWGEVKDIAFSLPETLMRTKEMVEHATMLKKIVDQTGYVSDDAIEGYTQLQGKRFGALNGKYVPTDMKLDITEFGNSLFGEEGKLLGSKAMEAFKVLSTFWKKSHTVYNPIAHLNNLVSNVTMQFGAGVNPHKAIANATKGALANQKVNQFRELTAKKLIGLSQEEQTTLRALSQDEDLKLWNQAQEAGLFGRSNLNDILNKYVNPTPTPTRTRGLSKAAKKIDDFASNMYQGEDNIMRFSMMKSLMEDGATFDAAFKRVNETIPDYTKPMSQWARFGRDSMLTPFISWTYYATPIILKQMKDRPERVVAIYAALYGMNQMWGIDPFNEKDIPQQNFAMKRIPIYQNGNEVTTVKVDRWVPHGDVLSPLDFAKNLTSTGAWAGLTDVLRNRNSYFGGKITNREGGEKAYDLTKYAVSQITPDILDNIGGLIESSILSKEKRTKNPVIQPRTTTQELLKILGINSMTYNKSNQAKEIEKQRLNKLKKGE